MVCQDTNLKTCLARVVRAPHTLLHRHESLSACVTNSSNRQHVSVVRGKAVFHLVGPTGLAVAIVVDDAWDHAHQSAQAVPRGGSKHRVKPQRSRGKQRPEQRCEWCSGASHQGNVVGTLGLPHQQTIRKLTRDAVCIALVNLTCISAHTTSASVPQRT